MMHTDSSGQSDESVVSGEGGTVGSVKERSPSKQEISIRVACLVRAEWGLLSVACLISYSNSHSIQ